MGFKAKVISICVALVLIATILTTSLCYAFNSKFKDNFNSWFGIENEVETSIEKKDSSDSDEIVSLQEQLKNEQSKNEQLKNDLSARDEIISELPCNSISILDNNSKNFGSGNYSVVTSLLDETDSVDFSDSISTEVKYYSDVYIFILPDLAGYYLSRIHFAYTPSDEQIIFSYPLILDQKTHNFTFDDGTTLISAVDGLHDGIELFNSDYNDSIWEFSDSSLDVNISYSDYLQDYSYVCLKINNLKHDLIVANEYTVQQYEVEIYSQIIDDSIPTRDLAYTATTYVNYGDKTLGKLTTMYTNSSFGVTPVWFYDEIKLGNEVLEEALSKNVTSCLSLIALYDLTSTTNVISANFYSWNSDKISYSKNDLGTDYVFSGFDMIVDELTNQYTINKTGLVSTLSDASDYIWTWAGDPKSNFSFTFDGVEWLSSETTEITNSYEKVKSVKLNSLPVIESSYNELTSDVIVYFTAEELIEKINLLVDEEDKFDCYSILDILNENICWKLVNTSNGVATIEFIGDENSILFGKTITVSILTTETEFSSTIYAVQTYSA